MKITSFHEKFYKFIMDFHLPSSILATGSVSEASTFFVAVGEIPKMPARLASRYPPP